MDERCILNPSPPQKKVFIALRTFRLVSSSKFVVFKKANRYTHYKKRSQKHTINIIKLLIKHVMHN